MTPAFCINFTLITPKICYFGDLKREMYKCTIFYRLDCRLFAQGNRFSFLNVIFLEYNYCNILESIDDDSVLIEKSKVVGIKLVYA